MKKIAMFGLIGSMLLTGTGGSCEGSTCAWGFNTQKNLTDLTKLKNARDGLEIRVINQLPTYKKQSPDLRVIESKASLNAKICAGLPPGDPQEPNVRRGRSEAFFCDDLVGTIAPKQTQSFYVTQERLETLLDRGHGSLMVMLGDDISNWQCLAVCFEQTSNVAARANKKQVLNVEVIESDTLTYDCNLIVER